MTSENSTGIYLRVTADSAVLKRLIEDVIGAGTAAQKSTGEISRMGAALKIATDPAPMKALVAELARTQAAQAALTSESAKMRSELQRLSSQVDRGENSIAAYQAETRRLTAEVQRLQGHLASAVTGLVRVSDAQNRAEQTARAAAAGQAQHAASVDQSGSTYLGFTAILNGAVALAVRSVGRALIETELELAKVRMTLLAASGSTAGAAENFEFLSTETERIGLTLTGSAPGFARFAIAATGAGLSMDAAREIFTGFAEAAVVMGLSVADTEGIFRALEQMFSKGVVSAEELRGQLGERLPGAFNMAAASMGMTTFELGKLLEGGKVLASDLVPKLSQEVRRQFGGALPEAMRSTRAELSRLSNAVTELQDTVNQGGLAAEFAETVKSLASAIRELNEFAEANPGAMALMGNALKAIGFGVFIASAATSLGALNLFVAGLSAGAVSSAIFAGQLGLVVAAATSLGIVLQQVAEAYGEMRMAQLDEERSQIERRAGLIDAIKDAKSAAEMDNVRRLALVQLTAAQRAYDEALNKTQPQGRGRAFYAARAEEINNLKVELDRTQSIVDLIDERGAAIASENNAENERLEALRAQTAEIEKQREEIEKRVALFEKTKTAYDKAAFDALSPDAQLGQLYARLSVNQAAAGAPFQAGAASTPEEVQRALQAEQQRFMELEIERMAIESQILAIEAAQAGEIEKSGRFVDQIIAATEREMKAKQTERDRARADNLREEVEQSRRVREGKLANIDANISLTEREKKELRQIALLEEQKEITEDIIRLRRLANGEPEGSATQAAAQLQLSATQDRQQFGLPRDLNENRPLSFGEDIRSQMADLEDGFMTIGTVVRSTVGSAIDGVAGSIQGLIQGTMSWGDALRNIGGSILNGVISAISQMFAEWIIKRTLMHTVGLGFLAAEGAAETAKEVSTLPAKTAGAAAAGISSYGLAIAGGLAALALIASLSGGFASGGYTGPGGVNEFAGAVHKGEIVWSQENIRAAGGVDIVEAMRVRGGYLMPSAVSRGASSAPVMGAASGGGRTAAQPTINLAFFDSRVSAEKWAESQEGQAHIVDTIQRNFHRIAA